jgi:hypothetical protein
VGGAGGPAIVNDVTGGDALGGSTAGAIGAAGTGGAGAIGGTGGAGSPARSGAAIGGDGASVVGEVEQHE